MLSTLWTIAKNAFAEVIRQPIYAILLVIGMALIAFSPAITMFSMVEDEKLMVDMALATILMLGVVMAVLGATQVISREIEAETAGAVLSKPVGRLTFVTGKFLGVSMAMFLTSYLLIITLLATLRIGVPSSAEYEFDWPAAIALVGPAGLATAVALYGNYFYRWNFTSTAMTLALPFYTVAFGLLLMVTPHWGIDLIPRVFVARHAGQVAIAAGLVALGVWVLGSVAVAASTRLNVVMNAIVCLSVFFLGMVSRFLFGNAASLGNVWISVGALLLVVGVLVFVLGPLNGWLKLIFGIPALIAGGALVVVYEPARVLLLRFAGVYAWLGERIVPNLESFWVADNLMQKVPYIPPTYVGMTLLYALAYCASMVALAAYLFERREVI